MSFLPFICDVCGNAAPATDPQEIDGDLGKATSYALPSDDWSAFGNAPDIAEATEVLHACSEPCAGKLRARTAS